MYNLAGIEVRVGKKSMCLAAAKAVAVAAAKLLLARWLYRYYDENLKHNGPAV